jgi:pyruvate-formate lyase-activating enzyme
VNYLPVLVSNFDLPILASEVARITGVGHQHTATVTSLMGCKFPCGFSLFCHNSPISLRGIH